MSRSSLLARLAPVTGLALPPALTLSSLPCEEDGLAEAAAACSGSGEEQRRCVRRCGTVSDVGGALCSSHVMTHGGEVFVAQLLDVVCRGREEERGG